MNKSNQFSPEVREHAVRMVQEHRGEYPLLWAAIESIAPKIGCVPEQRHTGQDKGILRKRKEVYEAPKCGKPGR